MTEKQIRKRVLRIKEELMKMEEMRPGSLTRQKRGDKGEYYQLSYTHLNRGRTEYIRAEFAQKIKRQIENYKNFKNLTNEWVTLEIELSKLNMQIEKKEGRK